MNLKEICLTLCGEIYKLVPYDRAAINLRHGEDHFAVYAEESRLRAAAIPDAISVVEGTATGWVLRHKTPVICRDIASDDRFPLTHGRYAAVGIRAYVIIPLIFQQQMMGALNLGSFETGRFGEKELNTLQPIADILALAIQNSRLYEQAREREEMQKLLKELNQDIAVLEVDSLLQKLTHKIRDVLKVDVSDVRLMDEGEWRSVGVSGIEPGKLQPTSSGAARGVSRRVLETGRPVMIPDVTAGTPDNAPVTTRHGFRGYAGVPLVSRNGEVIGVLRVLSYAERRFNTEEVDLLQQLAAGAAVALENTRLFREVLRQSRDLAAVNARLDQLLQEQSAMRQVFSSINLLDVDELLKQLTGNALTLLRADLVRVLLSDGKCIRAVSGHSRGAELELGHTWPVGQGRSGWVIEHGRPLAIEDFTQETRFGEPAIERPIGMKGYLGIPLISRQQKTIGLLVATTVERRRFTPEEIAVAEQFAAGAAIAIENACLLDETMQKSRQLEDAYKLRSDFLNTMAHELKSPLNVIIGSQQLLCEGSYGTLAEEQLKPLARIGKYSTGLLRLINEILELMRLDAKKETLHREKLPVRDLTDDLELSFEPLAREKGLELKFRVAQDIPPLWTDPDRLKEVLHNLLANAVKYTDGGRIEVGVSTKPSAQGERLVLSVSDTGIGIEKSDLPHIFEPFYMAENVDRRKYPGSGLGLSIVKRIVELFGGEIHVESEPGRGSIFTVTLPLDAKVDAEYA